MNEQQTPNANLTLTHNSPKYSDRNLAKEILEGFFPLKYAVLPLENA